MLSWLKCGYWLRVYTVQVSDCTDKFWRQRLCSGFMLLKNEGVRPGVSRLKDPILGAMSFLKAST